MNKYVKNRRVIRFIRLILGIFAVMINTSCCITGYCQTTDSPQQGIYKDQIKEYNTN
ncbi:hypothetical protein [Dysgonomonas sp. 521]|uniref:hypothetical protein n=1 Tax=Dysgonomonas sp. 521 TaxID=2302932 RepID=UPI001629D3AC|nr:hypothetical protein [Dysgonomonas sp. 521]